MDTIFNSYPDRHLGLQKPGRQVLALLKAASRALW